jgi:hypothetical protein
MVRTPPKNLNILVFPVRANYRCAAASSKFTPQTTRFVTILRQPPSTEIAMMVCMG